jgi:hypothetical protein
MKRFVPLLALFAGGVAASFALASPPPGHGPHTGSSQTSTSGGPGKSGQHGNARCHPINLKGTVAGGTITLNVTQAAGPHAKQIGNSATLQIGGKVSVQAWACGAPGAAAPQTLFLKQLHVGGSPHNFGSTTTTTTGP